MLNDADLLALERLRVERFRAFFAGIFDLATIAISADNCLTIVLDDAQQLQKLLPDSDTLRCAVWVIAAATSVQVWDGANFIYQCETQGENGLESGETVEDSLMTTATLDRPAPAETLEAPRQGTAQKSFREVIAKLAAFTGRSTEQMQAIALDLPIPPAMERELFERLYSQYAESDILPTEQPTNGKTAPSAMAKPAAKPAAAKKPAAKKTAAKKPAAS